MLDLLRDHPADRCRRATPHGRSDTTTLNRWAGRRSGCLLADAGYSSDTSVQDVGEVGAELMIATRSDRNRSEAGPLPPGCIPTLLPVRRRMARNVATQRGRRLYEPQHWMVAGLWRREGEPPPPAIPAAWRRRLPPENGSS